MSEIMSQAAHDNPDSFGGSQEYVTFVIAGQLFGIPVLKVQDILSSSQITRIPLAPPEISGSLNLRGRIVTAMDVRRRLGLPPRVLDVRVQPQRDAERIMVVPVFFHLRSW